ncbi:hypothetical protein CPIN18021_0293 [Campylobacter pinnipediorum subsp. caledonicus]|uniref:Uncharacterized protein n=1 Tax=Campylobacter pinnipediorum subsp. caledonicus TaxID=1874362 RepID=A0A1S6U645_9BACT|nr:hypothetical protein [Campylobacter pinnipediorum]AQW85555.1 hypothetical protein CPIN18020_0314 [Campylobacter pinnipediorum subsp. caledonicus]AQW87140.1 hypothetical protein CPIN18021_0293 [Campylobacter pinnipediorum subsp. caledonicus]OPA71838.1 hypothetical protein BB381_06790 [Campylobacter pinnipediorum subsp. caledonicus]
MIASEFKKLLSLRGKSGINLPSDELLNELVKEAIVFVATKCVPSELVVKDTTNIRLLRRLSNGFGLRIPDKVDINSTEKHIQIDEVLTYAVMYEVLFLLNKDMGFRQLAMDIINQFNANDGIEVYYD